MPSLPFILIIVIIVVSTISKAKQTAQKRPGAARPVTMNRRVPEAAVRQTVSEPGMAAAPRAPQSAHMSFSANDKRKTSDKRVEMELSAREEMQVSKRDEMQARVRSMSSPQRGGAAEDMSAPSVARSHLSGAGANKLSAQDMRRAVILSEVLSKPLALRSNGETGGISA